MTSVRQSFVFALEDKFKGGKGANKSWIAPPPGSYFSNTNSRQTSAIYASGTKKWETTAYGAFAGNWDWTFMMDYKYLEPFMLVFDKINGVQYSSDLEDTSEFYNPKSNEFKFTKEKIGKAPTFCVRRKILHKLVGGTMDEQVELKGCIVQSISFSRSATSSQYQVSMSGVYATEEMKTGDLNYATDYQDYDGQLVEYSCVLLADSSTADISSAKYVANTDSTSISITNNVSMVYSTCIPFATQYCEDRNQFQISTSCYSTNPEAYKTRVYSGGYNKAVRAPMSKNLKPLAKMFIVSFDSLIEDDADADTAISNAMNSATHYVKFEITNAVLKSMKWVNGDGSKLTDSLSSVDCRDISMTVKTAEKLILHTVNSTEISSS